jgi:Phosphoinositide phospholipase C, Ca2+-dependent
MFLRTAMQIAVGATALVVGQLVMAEQHDSQATQDKNHAPLADQLSGGMRQIEIDVFADPDGGRFAHPAIVRNVAAAGLPADPDSSAKTAPSLWTPT